MVNTKSVLLAIAAIPITAVLLFAQSNTGSTNNQPMQGMQMGNGQMMQGCRKNMQSMMDSNAQTTKDIEAAKQSNDPAKMRVALDEAEKALSPMNEHMKGCMKMMNMMQNMHGKSGMMGPNNMQDKGQKTQPQN